MSRPSLLLAVVLSTGCASSATAYRAHFDSEPEVAAFRECAARCDAASAQGEDVHRCLSSCPGFEAHPGDRCAASTERPGTYCVTVEDSVRPNMDFWFAVAEVAAETAATKSSNDDDDDDASPSRSSAKQDAPATGRTPARPSARPAESRSRVSRRGR